MRAERSPPLGPVPGGPDDELEAFMAASAARGLDLYPAQEEAVLALAADSHVILETPTGSGKSWVAAFAHLHALSAGRRAVYTCPIKALVSEKFFQLAEDFGAERVGMLTGEARVNPDAPILVCTQEILAQMALAGDRHGLGLAVMDEFHFYGDRARGVAWQVPLLRLGDTQFLLMSATLGEVGPIVRSLGGGSREVAHVRSPSRPVPLTYLWRETPLFETLVALAEAGRTPAYVVHFTHKSCLEAAQAATSLNLVARDDRRRVADFHAGFRFDSPFGRDMRRYLSFGIGVHHAGMLPKYRRLVERLAQAGLLPLIMGTDTLGVGINVPIRTVLFTQLCKYDGRATAILSVRDFRQIAGRAGRRGFDTEGFVVAQAPAHVIENQRAAARVAARGRQATKVVKKKPPEHNFVPWSEKTFRGLAEGEVAPLGSHFRVDYGMLLTALRDEAADAQPYRRLVTMICRCHDREALKKPHLRRLASCFRALRAAGVLSVRPPGARPRLRLEVDIAAQASLEGTLGLWLLDTLPALDADSETYPLDLLSLVEATLESPGAILARQVDRLRRERLAALKAEGVPYEERQAELEGIEHPKPLAELIYTAFNLFAGARPWVEGDHVRPKSIAREMVETHASFPQYVRELGLERQEGVLLRYLSQVYKAWVGSVPASFRQAEGCLVVEDFLDATLRHVDDSLLLEWEALVGGRAPAAEVRPAAAAPEAAASDPERAPAAFLRMLRQHLHQLVQALGRRDLEEAASWLVAEEGAPAPAEALGAGLSAFLAEHRGLEVGPRARQAEHTQLTRLDPERWRVAQVLCDPAGDDDWVLEGIVHLADARARRVPCIRLLRLGR